MEEQKHLLDISWGAILKISVMVIAFYVFYQIREVLVWFIFGIIISILFAPAIDFLKKFKIPHGLAVALVYVGFFGLLSLFICLLIPVFVSEIQEFSQVLPQYLEKISPQLKGVGLKAFEDVEATVSTLEGILNGIAGNILSVLFSIFGGIFTTTFILSMAIFLSLEEKGIEKALILFFPKKYETSVLSLWRKCQKKVSNWFFTRILACLFVGAVSYIAFLVLNVKYPFTLGLVAGIFNFIPFVGPVITGLLLFGLTVPESLFKAIFATVIFSLIQTIENNILTPILSKKFIGIPPVVVLISLAVGGILWGFLGAILSIPLAGILFEFLKDFLKQREQANGGGRGVA